MAESHGSLGVGAPPWDLKDEAWWPRSLLASLFRSSWTHSVPHTGHPAWLLSGLWFRLRPTDSSTFSRPSSDPLARASDQKNLVLKILEEFTPSGLWLSVASQTGHGDSYPASAWGQPGPVLHSHPHGTVSEPGLRWEPEPRLPTTGPSHRVDTGRCWTRGRLRREGGRGSVVPAAPCMVGWGLRLWVGWGSPKGVKGCAQLGAVAESLGGCLHAWPGCP